jgi:L-lactate utilization protein LutB
MNSIETWRFETLGRAACEALKRNGFDAYYVSSGVEAVDRIAALVRRGTKVGIGGSMTLKVLGLPEHLASLGALILDHNAPGLDARQKMEIMRAQLSCDLFISGSNAITLDGDIVNVDGNGNRVAALSFGPKKVVVVVGANKITRDIDEALARIETVAGPMNNKRFEKPNPCLKSGTCEDCRSESRICRVYQILRRKPFLADFTVYIAGEELGF